MLYLKEDDIDHEEEHGAGVGLEEVGILCQRSLEPLGLVKLEPGIENQAERNENQQHGLVLPAGYIRTTDPDIESAAETAVAMLSQKDPPTAIFGANDEIATGVMKAAIRLGLKVPEDLAVVGYDDSRVCRALEPELTSVHVFRNKMGKTAAGLLLDLLKGEDSEAPRIVIEPELIVRRST